MPLIHIYVSAYAIKYPEFLEIVHNNGKNNKLIFFIDQKKMLSISTFNPRQDPCILYVQYKETFGHLTINCGEMYFVPLEPLCMKICATTQKEVLDFSKYIQVLFLLCKGFRIMKLWAGMPDANGVYQIFYE